MVHSSGSAGLIRAKFVRALMASVVLAGTLALAGCYTEDGYQLPTRAMKELSPQMLAMLEQRNMPKDSPVLLRIFKEESELEVWKQDTTGRFQILKVYPICRWSGDLGPKVHEGDRQAPEGFYTITPDLMQPNSNYYLAINTGFPNAYDKANDRHGAFLMIHGDCSSRGCYAMTDEQIGEIYSLARESFLGGQKSFQIQAYPFRMTPANLAHHRNSPNMAFWKMIKEGSDHFEVSHLEPKVDVCNRHYVFDAVPLPNATKPLVFNPTGACPNYAIAPEMASLVTEKEHNDEVQFAALVKSNLPLAPVHSGLDGGMNRVFLAQVGGNIPPARVVPPDATTGTVASALPPQPQPASGGWLGNFFGSKSAGTTQVASGDSAAQERGGGGSFFGSLFGSNGSGAQADTTATSQAQEPKTAAQKPKPAPRTETASAKSGESARKAEPQEASAKTKTTPEPQQQANAAAPPASSTLNGSQPVVPAGSFDSRWSISSQ
jgi:murein L,D-transpeptidase YafK